MKKKNGSFWEHRVLLCLAPELYIGFIRLQAERGLGRAFAGLLPFVEGLFRLGYLSREDYETYNRKYSQALVQPKKLSNEQLLEQKKHAKLEAQFSAVVKEWNQLSERAQKQWARKAQACLDTIPNAKLVLALANGNGERQ